MQCARAEQEASRRQYVRRDAVFGSIQAEHVVLHVRDGRQAIVGRARVANSLLRTNRQLRARTSASRPVSIDCGSIATRRCPFPRALCPSSLS